MYPSVVDLPTCDTTTDPHALNSNGNQSTQPISHQHVLSNHSSIRNKRFETNSSDVVATKNPPSTNPLHSSFQNSLTFHDVSQNSTLFHDTFDPLLLMSLVETLQMHSEETHRWKQSISEHIQHMDMKMSAILNFIKKNQVHSSLKESQINNQYSIMMSQDHDPNILHVNSPEVLLNTTLKSPVQNDDKGYHHPHAIRDLNESRRQLTQYSQPSATLNPYSYNQALDGTFCTSVQDSNSLDQKNYNGPFVTTCQATTTVTACIVPPPQSPPQVIPTSLLSVQERLNSLRSSFQTIRQHSEPSSENVTSSKWKDNEKDPALVGSLEPVAQHDDEEHELEELTKHINQPNINSDFENDVQLICELGFSEEAARHALKSFGDRGLAMSYLLENQC
ncbi:hypothetical protein C9374_011201 [Naegleria lovaniensis]|uniref:UBA domain-containing protein n=1 Tax=Naegleria lovaniensis TaxID=51637 RepID=A0AA88KIN2_NAELO|nr:uncharacterized protein C9374_011201 [Naegleria lovaniensis]KAG2374122.1 hypothetical protein C9374_011201 [Naegleria lovaniensis]